MMTRSTLRIGRAVGASLTTSVWTAALVVCVAAMTLAGCGHSMPTRYVTLNPMPADAPPATAPMPPIQLTAVHIPAVLDRLEVVTLASQNRLTIDDTDRWGAPLAQMMRKTLAEDLLTRLPAGSFVVPDAPPPPGTRRLVVTVLNATANASGTLTLQAEWTLLNGHSDQAPLRQQVTLDSAIDGHDALAQAAALSRILADLADRIAASVVAH
ncbi:PqiC family protein [Paraburkholderia youngii]|uniref:Membrane integrity-associated transporter subunit PqiC n=1 Tax=Paraburkholderia youngii TaxID=2782701 RepID=A0ABX2NFS8_9BURK|nr:ABC-type transport auxiliary lipoprotein family protein [Paraburkholderia youngii]NVI03230.1 membrane integrity-associated transporter subunit PqiC [Paraburkholderia youngii]